MSSYELLHSKAHKLHCWFLSFFNSSSHLKDDHVPSEFDVYDFIRGIKHDFPFINICKVPREVLKTEGEARGFQPSRGTLRMLMNGKIMFDHYYCINSANHCKNKENIGALYFITSSHFPTRIRF